LLFGMIHLETRDDETLPIPLNYREDRPRVRDRTLSAVVELAFKIEDAGGIDVECLHHFPETLDPLACFHHSVTSFGPWFLSCVNIVTTISTMIAAGTEMMTELMPVDCT